jgi:anti-sigma B factor antagonist
LHLPAEEEMNVQEHASVITLSGDIDLAAAGALAELEKKLVVRDRIVFDVAGLKHIDSTFLRFLVGLKEHVARDRSATIELIGVTPRLRRILHITGLAPTFVQPAESSTR